jgi:hypothetical protein
MQHFDLFSYYKLDERSSIPSVVQFLFSFQRTYYSRSDPASYPVGARILSSEATRPELETKHSPPSSAEVNNASSHTSMYAYVFKVWCTWGISAFIFQ